MCVFVFVFVFVFVYVISNQRTKFKKWGLGNIGGLHKIGS